MGIVGRWVTWVGFRNRVTIDRVGEVVAVSEVGWALLVECPNGYLVSIRFDDARVVDDGERSRLLRNYRKREARSMRSP